MSPNKLSAREEIPQEQQSENSPEVIQLHTGEMLQVSQVANSGLDKVLDGYLRTAQVLGSELAAELYKKANPGSNLSAGWFEAHKNLGANH